jgi:hypothetical protein
MRTRTLTLDQGVAIAGVLLLAHAVAAQFAIPTHSITNGGGTTCGGAGFSLSGSIGQQAAGPSTGPMTGGNFSLRGGLWPAAAAPPCPGDANGDGTVNFADITDVLTNFNFMYSCGEADGGDADNNGVVNFADVTEVLKNFNVPCP